MLSFAVGLFVDDALWAKARYLFIPSLAVADVQRSVSPNRIVPIDGGTVLWVALRGPRGISVAMIDRLTL